ncbi:MAG TPA: hypothetical protein VFG07_01455, partial [Thermoplasmata archaeon]|nr:hypothetical protein [Thermoplasmata archaeon]
APMPPPPPPPPVIPMTPELQHYFELLGQLENTSRSLVLGPDDAVVADAAVKDVVEALAALETPAKTLVFDGVVSQRLLDAAHEKGIQIVVANRMGAVGKIPEPIRIVTRQDVEAPAPR